jgi:hypothetical protein
VLPCGRGLEDGRGYAPCASLCAPLPHKRAKVELSMHPCLNVRSCTSTERIILVARTIGKMSPFATGVKGELHGIGPLFLPIGADCTLMAVPYAPYAVAPQASL